ncbi:MAG TPA: hypothetical protein PLV72_01245 [Candidatus Magasanikbacteria bacterium]|nr:hypothetical protein [Candidatus Magasanikbacteria bacterium]
MSFWGWRADVTNVGKLRKVEITVVFLPSAKKIGADAFADIVGLKREDVEGDDSFPQHALCRGRIRGSRFTKRYPEAVITHTTYVPGEVNTNLPFVPDFVRA